jgi:outer membrane receptor protein involved in Fe transport
MLRDPIFLPTALARAVVLYAALSAVGAAHAADAGDLTALSLEQLLEVKVVGASKYEQRQSEVAAAVSVITRQEIEAFGWRTIDEALASLPGVYTTYDRQYSYLGTRGFTVPGDYTTRVLVTINGNRANDAIYDAGPMGRQFPLDLDLVERIEFIPGPGGAVFGQNAMFGVINIITRDGKGVDGVEAAVRAQQPQRAREARLTWGRKLDNGLDVLLSVSSLRERGEDRFFEFGSAGVSGVAVGLDGRKDDELFVRVARGPWSFDFMHGDHRKDDPTGAYLSDPLVAGQYQGDVYDIAQVQYQDSFAADTLHLTARAFGGRERYRSRLSYTTAFDFPATGEWRGVELRLLSTAWNDHKVLVGLEAQDNTRLEQSAIDNVTPANNLLIAKTGYRWGVFVQDEWRLADTLSATLGLRADRNNVTGSTTSPRAALIWQATPATTIKALYGRAHRAPNSYERDYDDGFAQLSNPQLRGERIDTLELVADHRVGDDLALRGALYQWKMHDLITLGLDPSSGIAQYQSGPRVQARGLELSADKTWSRGTRARASVSLQDVAYDGGGALLNSPKVLARLNVSAPLPWWGLRAGYEMRYDSARLSLDGSRLPGFVLSNVHLTTGALAKDLDLSLTVGNLFDKRYVHPGADTNWQNALDQDGRSVRLAATYRF